MKKLIITIGIIGSILPMSCLDPDDIVVPEQTCKLSKVSFDLNTLDGYNNLTEYTVTYTGDNITKMESGGESFVFEYNGDRITKHTRYSGSTVITKVLYTTDNDGKILKMDYEHFSGNSVYKDYFTFTYSGNKLIKMLHYDVTDGEIEEKIDIEWTGENPTKYSAYDENDVLQTETNFTYDTTKINKFNQTFKNFMIYDMSDDWIKHIMYLGKNEMITAGYVPYAPPGNYNITYNYYALTNLHNKIIYSGADSRIFTYDCN